MCSIGYHNCPTCGEEISCYQPDYECSVMNNLNYPCEKCEYWMEELHKEEERKATWEQEQRKRWAEEYGYVEED